MPVAITKNVSIKDKEGRITVLTETDQVAESTDLDVTCDSSRCASRHEGKVAKISWNLEAVREKPEALPDSFFRLLSLIVDPKTQAQKVFCSAGCARDFLQYDYVAPLSPQEEAVLLAQNRQAEIEKHRPKTNVVQFQPKAAPEVGSISHVTPDASPCFDVVKAELVDTPPEAPVSEPNAGLVPLTEGGA